MTARERIARVAAPVALVVLILVAWQVAADTGALADVLSLPETFVPAPDQIATSLWEDRELLADNARVTLGEVLLGFLAALAAGLLLAASMHLLPPLRRALYPITVASQTIPILVVAPVFVIWFGFGIGPKIAIVALICFFPIVVNTLDGLAQTPSEERRLMRSLGASRFRTFTTLEAPGALPFLFSGAKIAIAVAVIGAVFGEWAGANEGLGHLILQDNRQAEVARLFASVTVLSAMAMVLFALLSVAERRLVPWRGER